MIQVQREDFNLQSEYQKLQQSNVTGAVTMFCGLVRDFRSANGKSELFELQHYPGMTEKVLERIEAQAHKRWELLDSRIIHRVGPLAVDEQIVFIGVSSKHRADAFAACEFLIDLLKTEAPFWKKEGGQWVEARDSDAQRATRWMSDE
ncbi:molybdenum cofactor biosynthesis protein MoaE [Agaribacterium sp. ZY112]|uniref:molybdenum cofactor biosynthesis protein MoaE n=1 Tax=Agaribacterium sp. ZY112 TaxID=3233574 RepID=UPI00352682D6